MQSTIRSLLAAVPVALCAAGASAAGHAGHPVAVHVHQVHGAPGHGPGQPVYGVPGYGPGQPVYGGHPHDPYGGYGARHPGMAPAQAACGAPRWNPRQRYMPGQVVWRRGSLWMAKGVSARVWNENSPPEWTPQYWVQAICR